MTDILTAKKLTFQILTSLLILLVVMGICTVIGQQSISLTKVFEGADTPAGANVDYQILVGIRIPRVILAAIIGAALACSGATLQAILRNPLADPFILGISSGAGLGAIIAILSGLSWNFLAGSPIAAFAFVGALAAVWLVWGIGHFAGGSNVTTLLLAGVVVNAFLSAVIMFLTSISKTDQLHSIIFWLMGNISEKNLSLLLFAAICVLAGVFILSGIGRKLNILSLGDEEAKGLGLAPEKIRTLAFCLSALITAVAVSLSGLVGFVGLIVPHGIRLVFGSDHRRLIPLSAIFGAIFLIIADTIARTIVAPAQMPVGIITALAGGPFFLYLLAKYTRKINWTK